MVTNIPLQTLERVIALNVQALVFTIITIAKNFKGNALRVTAKVGCLIVTTHAPNLITTNPLNNNLKVVVKDKFNYIMETTIMALKNVDLVRNLMLSALFDESQESVEPKLMQKLDKVASSSDNWNSTVITNKNIKAIQEYGYNDIKVGDKLTVQQDSGEEIVVQPGFGVMMTGNLNQGEEKYIDRQDMDPAFLSRLYKKEYDYLPQETKGGLDEAGEGDNELFLLLLSRVMDKNGNIEAPEDIVKKIWNMAKAAQAVEQTAEEAGRKSPSGKGETVG